MITNCSISTSLTGLAADYAITGRDRIIYTLNPTTDQENCCLSCTFSACSGVVRAGFGLIFAALFVACFVESIARIFFAAMTFPLVFIAGEFFEKAFLNPIIHCSEAMWDIAEAFYENIVSERIRSYLLPSPLSFNLL